MLSDNISNERQFLMAMIPFMRGYAHISNNCENVYEELSGVMHGYETSSINATEIYQKLFEHHFTMDYIKIDQVVEKFLNCQKIKFFKHKIFV